MVEYVSDFGLGSRGQELVAPPIPNSFVEYQTVASLASGGYAVSYTTGGDTYLRLYNADGTPRGSPFAVGESNMYDVRILGLPGGGIVVVWSDSAVGVEAQFFDANGAPTSAIIGLDGSNNREQQPVVTVLEDGSVLVAWRANTATPSILARVLGPNGAALSDVFTVSQTDAVDVFFPQIDALAGGGFVVSWNESFRIAAQVYNSARVPIGATITLPEAAEYLSQRFQSVAALPDGRFIIVWNEVDPATTNRILAAIYTAEGAMVGAPFQANTDTRFDTMQPDIEVFDDGSFLIAWRLEVPGSGPNFFQIGDIRAQRFGADGQRVGGEFQVNDGSGEGQDGPVIAGFGSGDVAIVWRNWAEDSTNPDIQLRSFYSVTNADDSSNVIEGTAGVDFIRALGGVDFLVGGLGDDVLDGGSNVDTAVVRGLRSAYTVTQTSTGVFQVIGADGTDVLTAVEFLQFDDQVLRLRPGTGVSVNFNSPNPAVYQSAMDAIRDFDGNALGGNGAWLRIGQADVNGDGDIDQILVNDGIARFATVGTAPDGLTYFSDFSWAGETRVAGIYIDPLVTAGIVVAGSGNDSQRRFQNDLAIENINRVLGADDYDNDGLQEVYFALTDGTAYLRAIMEFDGNIRYANYQSQQEVINYLTANGFGPETYAAWFTAPSSAALTLQDNADEANPLGRAALPGEEAAMPAVIDPATFMFNAPTLEDYLKAEFYG